MWIAQIQLNHNTGEHFLSLMSVLITMLTIILMVFLEYNNVDKSF